MTKNWIIGVAFFVAATSADAWHLSQCTSTDLAKREAFGARLKVARSADSTYVPRPFPRTPDDVLADFLFQYNYLRHLPQADVMAGMRRNIDQAADQQQLDFAVIIIEDWRSGRCLSAREGDRVYLLRLLNRQTHEEIGRAWLEENGLLGSIAYRESGVVPAWWKIPVQGLDEAASKIKNLLKVEVTEPQYVATFGTLNCDVILPCIAMRAPSLGTTYVVSPKDGIYAFPSGGRMYRPRHDIDRLQQNSDLNRTLLPGDAVMSIGRDEFAVVHRAQ